MTEHECQVLCKKIDNAIQEFGSVDIEVSNFVTFRNSFTGSFVRENRTVYTIVKRNEHILIDTNGEQWSLLNSVDKIKVLFRKK